MRPLYTECLVFHLLVNWGEVSRLMTSQSLLCYFNYTTK